ncbi:hypothetical protein D3C84_805270 [compost metagenome]
MAVTSTASPLTRREMLLCMNPHLWPPSVGFRRWMACYLNTHAGSILFVKCSLHEIQINTGKDWATAAFFGIDHRDFTQVADELCEAQRLRSELCWASFLRPAWPAPTYGRPVACLANEFAHKGAALRRLAQSVAKPSDSRRPCWASFLRPAWPAPTCGLLGE